MSIQNIAIIQSFHIWIYSTFSEVIAPSLNTPNLNNCHPGGSTNFWSTPGSTCRQTQFPGGSGHLCHL